MPHANFQTSFLPASSLKKSAFLKVNKITCMQCEFKKPPYFLCNQKMLFSSLVELERQLSTTSTARTLIFACQLLPLLKKMTKIIHLRLPSVVTEGREKLSCPIMQSYISPLLQVKLDLKVSQYHISALVFVDISIKQYICVFATPLL